MFMFYLSNGLFIIFYFFFSSRRRHTRSKRDWSSDVCSSDLIVSVPSGSDGYGSDPGWRIGIGEDEPAAVDRQPPTPATAAPSMPARNKFRRDGEKLRRDGVPAFIRPILYARPRWHRSTP